MSASVALLADDGTPLVGHAWYAVATSAEVSRQPLSRAFGEDQCASEQISRPRRSAGAAGVGNLHIPTDAAGLAMRRHTKAHAAREADARGDRP